MVDLPQCLRGNALMSQQAAVCSLAPKGQDPIDLGRLRPWLDEQAAVEATVPLSRSERRAAKLQAQAH